jgi:hypothetical protein
MRGRQVIGVTAIGGAAIVGILAVRRWQLRWGATNQEAGEPLPGDDLITDPDLAATRAITIGAPADQVWQWIAQLGQGRGGFYSYDFLENLAGCDIHSADTIVPEWQDLRIGDQIRLAPQVALTVALLERGKSLVLRGGVPMRNTAPPYDFTWAFVLKDEPGGVTRLLVRERYAYTRPWARALVEPVEAVSFVMSQKMLRGIRDRAERSTGARGSPAHNRS